MTLIIGHRDGWMMADRRTSFGANVMPIVVNKVVNLGYALVGAAGDAGFRQLARQVLRDSTEHTLTDNISDYICTGKQDINVIVVTKSRRLCWCDEKGVFYELNDDQDWWVIGSGREIAAGYLKCWSRMTHHGLDSAAIEAIAYASTLDTQVGHEVQAERLRSPGLE